MGGDFNINLCDETNTKAEFETILNMNSCQNIITSPTRITSSSETLLDLFITNFDTGSLFGGVITYAISDHLPIFVCVEHDVNATRHIQRDSFYRSINENTLNIFREHLSNVNWDNVLEDDNPESAYENFMKKFTNIYYSSFPLKTFKQPKKARKPWVTGEMLKLIKKRDKLYRKFIQTKDPDALREFKGFRNHVTKELRASKRQYYITIFESAAKHSKDTWKIINSLLGRSPKPITKIVKGNCEFTKTDLANAFNDYFLSIAPLPTNTCCDFSYMKPHQQNTMFIDPVSQDKIILTFKSLKNSTTEDNLGLQSNQLKMSST